MIKKSIIFILILLIILLIISFIPTISAVEINMKTNFSQGETLLAKISGTFVQPLNSF